MLKSIVELVNSSILSIVIKGINGSSSERKDKKVNTEDISTMSRIKSAYISLTRMVERFE